MNYFYFQPEYRPARVMPILFHCVVNHDEYSSASLRRGSHEIEHGVEFVVNLKLIFLILRPVRCR